MAQYVMLFFRENVELLKYRRPLNDIRSESIRQWNIGLGILPPVYQQIAVKMQPDRNKPQKQDNIRLLLSLNLTEITLTLGGN